MTRQPLVIIPYLRKLYLTLQLGIGKPVLTSDTKQDGLLQLRLFDSKTGNNITNVNYFLTISKGGKELMKELFYSKEGPLTLKFQPEQRTLYSLWKYRTFFGCMDE